MTIQELVNWCVANNVPLNMPIAIRAKDDYLLTDGNIYPDAPYFGNCRDGDRYMRAIAPKDADGEVDYDNLPDFLILDTRRD